MPRPFALVPQLKLDEIDAYKRDVDASLRHYFAQLPPELKQRLFGKTPSEASDELQLRLDESDTRSSFFVLTSLEASFRIDFDYRCTKRLKDELSAYFRDLQREHGDRIRLDDDILEGWKRYAHAPSALISELRRAFKFRHWLAHGRYWAPKVGRKFDFESVYSMALLVSAFPFET